MQRIRTIIEWLSSKPMVVLCAGCVLLLFVFPDDLLARAGGGGGYGGGGGGGGRGSGGGEGLIQLLIWLLIRHPAIGVPVFICVVAFFYYSSKGTANQYRAGVIRRGGPILDRLRAAEGLEDLKRLDPDFVEGLFLGRAKNAFLKIQDAWSAQSLDPVRPFISDGIHERFSLQIAEQKDEGYRNVLDDINIQTTDVAEVIVDDQFQWLTVRIRASATDYRVDITSGKEIRGSRRPEDFTEFWTFLRRNHAKTNLNQNGLIEGDCPNCGAAIELAASEKCGSCDSLLRSGQHDWVLCEITQACEWDSAQPEGAPGLVEYRRTHDPGFNAQQLEDRASVIFWRKAMADRLGNIDPLAKMASDKFCELYRQCLATRGDGRRHYYGDCAVGAVIVRGVIGEGKLHHALVEVRWSGRRMLRQPDGRGVDAGDSVVYRSMFVLVRRNGVQTNVDDVVSSSHCPSCGAPEERLAAHACEFCGTVLNNGRHDWVLVAIHHMNSNDAQGLLARARAWTGVLPAPQNGQATARPLPAAPLLAWMIKTAIADEEVDAKERALLHDVGTRRKIPSQTVDAMISAAADGKLETIEPRNREEAQDWITHMTDLTLVDGKITRGELALLEQAGSHLGMGRYDLTQLVKKRKAELYRASRAALRRQRQTGGL